MKIYRNEWTWNKLFMGTNGTKWFQMTKFTGMVEVWFGLWRLVIIWEE